MLKLLTEDLDDYINEYMVFISYNVYTTIEMF